MTRLLWVDRPQPVQDLWHACCSFYMQVSDSGGELGEMEGRWTKSWAGPIDVWILVPFYAFSLQSFPNSCKDASLLMCFFLGALGLSPLWGSDQLRQTLPPTSFTSSANRLTLLLVRKITMDNEVHVQRSDQGHLPLFWHAVARSGIENKSMYWVYAKDGLLTIEKSNWTGSKYSTVCS